MKHSNIAIFVPHAGCPYQCAFCDQHAITAQQTLPGAEDVQRACEQAVQDIADLSATEIAFFGGSFTAIPRDYMLELLKAAQPYTGAEKCRGIRISTRPDCIDTEVLSVLKSYGVIAIELGAQSMSDSVLAANGRGHTSADVEHAARLIREEGFELGLQMMVGLYQSTMADETETVRRIIVLRPDTVRIYPTVVLKGTELAWRYAMGAYHLFSFEQVVDFCAGAMTQFAENGIRVIKCGLHASVDVERDMVAGFYHPAFRELCESKQYRHMMETQIQGAGNYTFAVHPSCVSKAVGHKKMNVLYFQEKGVFVKCIADRMVKQNRCILLDSRCTDI
ncbi:MAG: radical SAM protein [Oscillospiraceae bacterium]|nr:radical SAM protein [Oscillospiraceae bacterium]